MRRLYDLPYGIDPAQRVGDIVDRHYFNAFKQSIEFIQDQRPVLVDGYDPERGVLFFTGQLPGDDIGVVLDGGDQHAIARPQELFCKPGRYQVDGLGGAAGINDLVIMTGIDKIGNLLSCPFVCLGSLLTEIMHSPMDIAIYGMVIVVHGAEHLFRLLGGSGIVQINKGVAVDGPG